jgi:biotin carboxylase
MSERQLILLASAFSYRADAFEAAAKKLGVQVVRGIDVPPPMVGKVNTPLQIDYRDVPRSARRIEQYAKEHDVGAIIGLDDSGTLIAAAASQFLSLPYNAPEAARAARDKFTMRQHFATAGVASPGFTHHTLSEDPRELADQVRYPCVIKPTTLSGSRGVMRADNPNEFVQRVENLTRILRSEPCSEYLVEDFIPGIEVALEGLMDAGQLHVLALFDKPDPLDGPYFEETLYITPSKLSAPIQRAIRDTAAAAAASLGLQHGPIHAELRIDIDAPEPQPVMVEIAARSIGGSCSQVLRFDLDSSLEELIVRQALQLPLPLADRAGPQASGVMMIPIPESGILSDCRGLDEARAVPGIEDIEISAQMHHVIRGLPDGESYLGFIFAHAETPDAVEAALREAHSRLQFVILPEIELQAL